MSHFLKSFRLLLAAFLLAVISACGGGGAGSLAKDPTGIPPLGQGLTPQVERLIAEKYSAHPDLKRAADGWAQSMLVQVKDAVDTGTYNKGLTEKDLHAQACFMARAERYLGDIGDAGIVEFLAAMTPTADYLHAFSKANSLSSGHPVRISFDESIACSRAGVQ